MRAVGNFSVLERRLRRQPNALRSDSILSSGDRRCRVCRFYILFGSTARRRSRLSFCRKDCVVHSRPCRSDKQQICSLEAFAVNTEFTVWRKCSASDRLLLRHSRLSSHLSPAARYRRASVFLCSKRWRGLAGRLCQQATTPCNKLSFTGRIISVNFGSSNGSGLFLRLRFVHCANVSSELR